MRRLRATCRPRRRWRRSPRACARGAAAAASRCAALLAALGYQETINFSFVEARWEHELAGNADPIKLLNPIASQMSVMRSSRCSARCCRCCKFNLDRKAPRVRVFELGRVFLRDAVGRRRPTPPCAASHQPMRVAGLAWGAGRRAAVGRARSARVDFFDVKGDVEALLAPLQADVRAGRASGAASGPLRRACWLDGQRDRRRRRTASALAPGLGAAARAGAVRARPRRRAARAACRSSQPVPQPAGRSSATSRVVVQRAGHARRADGRASRADADAACCATRRCSTSTSPKAGARPDFAAGREEPGGAPGLLDATTRR